MDASSGQGKGAERKWRLGGQGKGREELDDEVFFSDGTELSWFLGRSKESGKGGCWPRQDMMLESKLK